MIFRSGIESTPIELLLLLTKATGDLIYRWIPNVINIFVKLSEPNPSKLTLAGSSIF